MYSGRLCLWISLFGLCSADGKWLFPGKMSRSARIDSKIRFNDSPLHYKQNLAPNREYAQANAQIDDFPYQPVMQGFYYQPGGNLQSAGAKLFDNQIYLIDNLPEKQLEVRTAVEADNTVDSRERLSSSHLCGPSMKICCFNKRNPTEYFKELVDDRPMLVPGRGTSGGPFPPPPDTVLSEKFRPGHAPEGMLLAALDIQRAPPILSRSHIASHSASRTSNNDPQINRPELLSSSNGLYRTTGHENSIQNDLARDNINKRLMLADAERLTAIIGPYRQRSSVGAQSQNPQPLIINDERLGMINVGSSSHEHVINSYNEQDSQQSQSAQRPILVGPGGATGIIGPEYNQRPILVGPGGPTGVIGPRRPILVGYGGPSVRIGPRRPVLVGPGGPTGIIGPYGVYRN